MAKEPKRGIGLESNKRYENQTSNRVNYLLIIGIDNYQHFSNLNNAVLDAKAFKRVLLKRYQFQRDHVSELIDQEATRKNILDKLEELENLITTDDNLIIYFSGHGAMNSRKTKGFWIPVEATSKADYIPNSQIRDHLEDIQAHHIYLIVDSCFSGSIVTRANEYGTKVELFPSRRVLSSGRNEFVSDGKMGAHSPFARCLIDYLTINSESLPATKLEQHVKEHTPRTANQTPYSAFMYGLGDQGGEFVFHPKQNNEETDWELAQEVDSISSYQQYLVNYPKGEFQKEANQRLKNLEESIAWEKAQAQDTIEAYKKFQSKFTGGIFSTIALKKIQKLEEEIIWSDTKKNHSIDVYKDFIKRYPNSFHNNEAHDQIEALENAVIDFQKFKIKSVSEVTPQMIKVHGGAFIMGAEENHALAVQNECPSHKVILSDFHISKYPITVREYIAFVNATNSNHPKWLEDNNDYNIYNGSGKDYYLKFIGQKQPIIGVTWHNAVAYAQWLSEQLNKEYRLPTEAEWEYAASGGLNGYDNHGNRLYVFSGTKYVDQLKEFAWYCDNSEDVTHPVGKKLSNPLGIYDMCGNVLEWCLDWHGDYDSKSKRNPKGPEKGINKIVRGGAWFQDPFELWIAGRNSFNPSTRGDSLGFRVVMID